MSRVPDDQLDPFDALLLRWRNREPIRLSGEMNSSHAEQSLRQYASNLEAEAAQLSRELASAERARDDERIVRLLIEALQRARS